MCDSSTLWAWRFDLIFLWQIFALPSLQLLRCVKMASDTYSYDPEPFLVARGNWLAVFRNQDLDLFNLETLIHITRIKNFSPLLFAGTEYSVCCVLTASVVFVSVLMIFNLGYGFRQDACIVDDARSSVFCGFWDIYQQENYSEPFSSACGSTASW